FFSAAAVMRVSTVNDCGKRHISQSINQISGGAQLECSTLSFHRGLSPPNLRWKLCFRLIRPCTAPEHQRQMGLASLEMLIDPPTQLLDRQRKHGFLSTGASWILAAVQSSENKK